MYWAMTFRRAEVMVIPPETAGIQARPSKLPSMAKLQSPLQVQ